MLTKHYINLTNGIEAIKHLPSDEAYGFIRIQSTTLERKDWTQMFTVDVCADMLLHLALGWKCVLHDRGTNRAYSKTCYTGVPLIKYVLDRRWFGLQPVEVYNLTRGGKPNHNVVGYYSSVYDGLMRESFVKRRLDYFQRYLKGGLTEVNFVADSCATTHDGDKEFYVELLNQSVPSN